MDNFLTGKPTLGESGSNAVQSESLLSNQQPQATTSQVVVDGCEGQSKVEVVNEDGTIRKIIVTCACGKVTELKCKY